VDKLSLLAAVGILLLSLGPKPLQYQNVEFYAEQVVDHVNVNDPESAVGEADGRFAEIKAGGQMTVVMEDTLYYLEGSDDGFVLVKGDAVYALAGLFQMSEEGSPAWQPLAPGSAPGRFKLGALRSSPIQSTATIRIVNDDFRPVYLDAVVGIRLKH
jgi:hypothetical protein